jgi:hypothetical protein
MKFFSTAAVMAFSLSTTALAGPIDQIEKRQTNTISTITAALSTLQGALSADQAALSKFSLNNLIKTMITYVTSL